MPYKPLPDLGIVLTFLREGQGWSQARLAEVAGIPPSLVNDYEHGRKTLARERLGHLASFMGLPPERIEATIECLEENRAASRAPGGPFSRMRRDIETVARQAGRLGTEFGRSLMTLLTFEGEALEAREHAERLWKRLKRRSREQRLALVEDSKKFRGWALCERVAAASIEVAADDPRESLDLAHLAVRIAELTPAEAAQQWRNEGYAWFHVANSRRVLGDLNGAKDALTKAKKLWEDGAAGDLGLLDETWVLWIEGTLLGYQGRFAEALRRLEDALKADRCDLEPRILLTKARILGARGNLEESTAVLREVEPHLETEQEPRLALGVRFELLVNLCLQDRAAEAAPGLPRVRELAERVGKKYDTLRLHWLEAKITAGLGRHEEAQASFEEVLRNLTAEGLAFDAALVSLDLALVLLAQGRAAKVRELAEQMTWVFGHQGVPQEALAAFQLFCDAASRAAATVELTRRVARFLHRAQLSPGLRFEKTEGAEAP